MSTLVIIVLVYCWNWIEFEKFQSFWKKMCVNLPNKWVKLHISTQILHENALFSGKIYIVGKNLHGRWSRRLRQISSLHPKGQVSCKRSSEGTILLQKIIQKDRPLAANDEPKGPAIYKWSSAWAGLLQMIIRRDRLCRSLCIPPSNRLGQNKPRSEFK